MLALFVRVGISIVLGGLFLALGTLVSAKEKPKKDAHHHDHGSHGGAENPALHLNKGKKWPTDKPLRTNMENIHGHLKRRIKRIKAKTLNKDEYARMGSEIERSIDNIFKNCKLEPAADAQLHIILSGMIKGKDTLQDKSSDSSKRQKAAMSILDGYKSYLKYFDTGSPR